MIQRLDKAPFDLKRNAKNSHPNSVLVGCFSFVCLVGIFAIKSHLLCISPAFSVNSSSVKITGRAIPPLAKQGRLGLELWLPPLGSKEAFRGLCAGFRNAAEREKQKLPGEKKITKQHHKPNPPQKNPKTKQSTKDLKHLSPFHFTNESFVRFGPCLQEATLG